jgi:uncharacterized cupredoxin-like copper-binding protein
MDGLWSWRRVRTSVVVAVVGGVVLTGCSSPSQGSGSSLMGGAGSDTGSGGSGGGGMGGGGSGGGGMGGGGYQSSAASCSSRPTSLPGSTVTVTLGDMGMSTTMGGTAPAGAQMMLQATPVRVPAGQVSFVVDNKGWRTHELIILPLDAGAGAGQRTVGSDGKVTEDGAVGEASTSCGNGAGDGISSGSASWVSITLPAGHYEMVCNLANHYSDGMHQELDVS